MNRRQLGRTGIEVSEIGYGAWGIGGSGWLGAEDDESLQALDRAIDLGVQQFHVWSDEWVGRGSWQEAIERLKAEGKIRAFGVSINDHQPANALKLIQSGVVDTVQVIYNVFDQAPEDELLPACREHGIGVLARVPLDEGALTGRIGPGTTFPEGDFRARYFRGDRLEQVERHVQAILDDLGIEREALAETALRYVLSHEAVSSVIPGMRSVRNVE